MRTEEQVVHELQRVRARLRKARKKDADIDMLYSAQQALGWVLGTLRAPATLEDFIQKAAEKIYDNSSI